MESAIGGQYDSGLKLTWHATCETSCFLIGPCMPTWKATLLPTWPPLMASADVTRTRVSVHEFDWSTFVDWIPLRNTPLLADFRSSPVGFLAGKH